MICVPFGVLHRATVSSNVIFSHVCLGGAVLPCKHVAASALCAFTYTKVAPFIASSVDLCVLCVDQLSKYLHSC